MVKYEEGSFVNSRQEKIFTVSYTPEPSSPPLGVLFFVHGFGEHVGRYSQVFTRICEEATVAVCSYDIHGHGKSESQDEKKRAYIEAFEDVVDDATQYLGIVQAKHVGIPCIIMGHSMGGLIAVHVLAKRPKEFSGIVLHSAAIDVEWTPVLRFQAMLGDCLACCCPYAKLVPAVKPEDMNPEPELIKEYLSDPMVYQGNVRARSGNEILKGFKQCGKLGPQVSVPVYACHGTLDKTTSLKAVKHFVSTAQSKDKKLLEIEGGYHEILFGAKKEEALSSLITWIKAHC